MRLSPFFSPPPFFSPTHYQYDELGRQTAVSRSYPAGQGGTVSETVGTTVYDQAGRVDYVLDAAGSKTDYDYDQLDRLTAVTLPRADGDGSQPAPHTGYRYNADGRLHTVADPLGNVTTYSYDDVLRQTLVTYPDPDGAGPQVAPRRSTPTTSWGTSQPCRSSPPGANG